MQKHAFIQLALLMAGTLLFFTQCDQGEEALDTLDDAQKIAALKDVSLTYDSLGYTLGLPEGSLSGKSFEALMEEDSARFANPANYTIAFAAHLAADNTGEDAHDAKFDGMDADIVLNQIESSPIRTTTGPFEVPAGDVLPVNAQNEINLETHRRPGLYMFRQIVDGSDLATTLTPSLLYEVGSQSGTIDIPSVSKDIPTRASDETKAFLQGLLDSGVLDAPVTQ